MMLDEDTPGRRIAINELEHQALQELVWDGYPYAALIYYLELRPAMDFATAIVGDRRRISEQALRECLERRPKPGSHTGQKKERSRHFIQRQLQVLCDYGLAARLPKQSFNDPMRFRLVLADAGLIRLEEERTRGDNLGAHNANPANARLSVVRSAQRSEQEERTTSGISLQQQQGAAGAASVSSPLPVAEIVECYHRVLPGLPRVERPNTPKVLAAIQSVWDMDPRHCTVRFYQHYFEKVATRQFLIGQQHESRKGPFKANFLFLMTPECVDKVFNGEYT